MASSLAQPSLPTPLLCAEKRAKTAKASLPKQEKNPLWVKHGAAMREMQHSLQMTLEEFAYVLQKDVRQVGRWMDGIERPQIESVLAIERFEGPMLIALAKRMKGIDVDTVVHIRRIA